MPTRREMLNDLEGEIARAQSAPTTGGRSSVPTEIAVPVAVELADDAPTPPGDLLEIDDLMDPVAVAARPPRPPTAEPPRAVPPVEVPRDDIGRTLQRMRNQQKQDADRALRTVRLLGLVIVQQDQDTTRLDTIEDSLEGLAADFDADRQPFRYMAIGMLLTITIEVAFGGGIGIVWVLRQMLGVPW